MKTRLISSKEAQFNLATLVGDIAIQKMSIETAKKYLRKMLAEAKSTSTRCCILFTPGNDKNYFMYASQGNKDIVVCTFKKEIGLVDGVYYITPKHKPEENWAKGSQVHESYLGKNSLELTHIISQKGDLIFFENEEKPQLHPYYTGSIDALTSEDVTKISDRAVMAKSGGIPLLLFCAQNGLFSEMLLLAAKMTAAPYVFVEQDEKTGSTLLHYAVKAKEYEVCKEIVKNSKIAPFIKDVNGRVPYDYLLSYQKQQYSCDFLEAKGLRDDEVQSEVLQFALTAIQNQDLRKLQLILPYVINVNNWNSLFAESNLLYQALSLYLKHPNTKDILLTLLQYPVDPIKTLIVEGDKDTSCLERVLTLLDEKYHSELVDVAWRFMLKAPHLNTFKSPRDKGKGEHILAHPSVVNFIQLKPFLDARKLDPFLVADDGVQNLADFTDTVNLQFEKQTPLSDSILQANREAFKQFKAPKEFKHHSPASFQMFYHNGEMPPLENIPPKLGHSKKPGGIG
jgi:hypothetical protein